jgi:hypothetical protein
VYGHGGVGKSTLVAQYGHDLKEQQTVCWTQAETKDKLITSYEYAARELGITDEQLTELKKEASSNYLSVLARKVYNSLEDRRQPVLLILDNAIDPKLIDDCLLHKPALVKVIIITRDKNSFTDYSLIELDAFSIEEGKAYIHQRLQSLGPSEKDIATLINEIGLIPQKLALATGYIREVKLMNVDKYIQKLQEMKKQGKKVEGKLKLPEVSLGLETLNLEDQLLMRYGAYLDPDFIPIPLVSGLLKVSDEEELDTILSRLERLSLITIINNPSEGIRIHREVQAACKEYQNWKEENKLPEEKLLCSILKILDDSMPSVTEEPDSKWDRARIYATNVAAILKVATQKEMVRNGAPTVS